MKGQILFSICASVGLHVSGALLVPWSNEVQGEPEGIDLVLLEVLGEAPSVETKPEIIEPSPEPATPTSPEISAAEAVEQEAPSVELKAEAPATVAPADSPPASDRDTAPAAKAPPVVAVRAKPAPDARASKGTAARGGSSISVSQVRYRKRAALSYPASALRQRAGGSVLLMVSIDENGLATDVSVLRSSGNSDLDRAASNCARQSTYEPHRIHGVAKPCRVEAPFTFDATALRR